MKLGKDLKTETTVMSSTDTVSFVVITQKLPHVFQVTVDVGVGFWYYDEII